MAYQTEENTAMTYLQVRTALVAAMSAMPLLVGPTLAGPLDPDCSVAKAARGMWATS
jgi:hypothetical protein